MDIALTISIIIMIIFISITIVGLIEENDPTWSIVGLLGILMDLLLGFGAICSAAKVINCEYIRPKEILRGKEGIVAKTDNENLVENNSHAFYSLKDDEIWIKKTTHIDSYGNVTKTDYKLTTKAN